MERGSLNPPRSYRIREATRLRPADRRAALRPASRRHSSLKPIQLVAGSEHQQNYTLIRADNLHQLEGHLFRCIVTDGDGSAVCHFYLSNQYSRKVECLICGCSVPRFYARADSWLPGRLQALCDDDLVNAECRLLARPEVQSGTREWQICPNLRRSRPRERTAHLVMCTRGSCERKRGGNGGREVWPRSPHLPRWSRTRTSTCQGAR